MKYNDILLLWQSTSGFTFSRGCASILLPSPLLQSVLNLDKCNIKNLNTLRNLKFCTLLSLDFSHVFDKIPMDFARWKKKPQPSEVEGWNLPRLCNLHAIPFAFPEGLHFVEVVRLSRSRSWRHSLHRPEQDRLHSGFHVAYIIQSLVCSRELPHSKTPVVLYIAVYRHLQRHTLATNFVKMVSIYYVVVKSEKYILQ